MPQIYRLARKVMNVRREQQLRWLWSRFIPVKHRSCAENIYHCCVWKTASQWIRNVMSAADVYRYSGLLTYAYEQHEGRDYRSLQVRTFDRPFPSQRIISPLYINYDSFNRMPKPLTYRAFFVVRDPRDLVVSHYFSTRYSHVENPGVVEQRSKLVDASERDGMILNMESMAEQGIFDALRSWVVESDSNERIKIFRFEDLVGSEQTQWVRKLLDHCDIPLPDDSLDATLKRLSFERLSGGRKPGDENKQHKYRSGKHGDWVKYFDGKVAETFSRLAGNLPAELGYE